MNAPTRRTRLAPRVLVKGRLVAQVPEWRHGSPSTYSNWACRCWPCTDAHTRQTSDRRDTRYAERTLIDGRLVTQHPGAIHGRVGTYNYWGCRCSPCTAAAVQTQRDAR